MKKKIIIKNIKIQAVHHAKMVDRITTGWDSRGALHNFYQANLRAIERGVKITRIFVVNRENLAEPDFQKVLLTQHGNDINVRIAFHDELPSTTNISNRNTDSSFDFAIYDDRVVTDVFSKQGKYFCRKPVSLWKWPNISICTNLSNTAPMLLPWRTIISFW
jgi:hypothetical protein